MAAGRQAGYGTTLVSSGTGNIGSIGKLRSISFSGVKAAVVDVTHLGSASGYREFLKGTVDNGTVTATCWLDLAAGDASHHKAAMDELATSNENVTWTATTALSQTVVGKGYINGFSWDIPGEDEGVSFELTIKLTGTGVADTGKVDVG